MAWRIESIYQDATKKLDAWCVYEARLDGPNAPSTRHLVGVRAEGARVKAQVSSAVEVFDPVRRRAVTCSGQVYELGIGPGFSPEAFALWTTKLRAHCVDGFRDVTDEVQLLVWNYKH